MALQTGGAAVQACAMRVCVLEQDGVPLPGAANLYTTDAMSQLSVTPATTKGADIEVMNACGSPAVLYKDRDRLKRYDLQLDMLTLDPEFEQILSGGETFTAGSFTVGGAVPAVATIEAPGGVSLELWTKNIVAGDLSPINPYVHWIIPRSYWLPDKISFMNGHMLRSFTGYTSQNPNFYNGPQNDWNFASDRSIAWCYTQILPTPHLGATAEIHS